KPPHQITIDFRIVKYDNQIALLVFDFSKRQEVPFDGSHIHPLLSTMIHPQLYTNFKQYDNHIVECRYDIVCQQISPVRIRYDKDGPNRLDIAEANWHDIHDTILQSDLIGNSLEFVKKYHNQVKNILYGLPTI